MLKSIVHCTDPTEVGDAGVCAGNIDSAGTGSVAVKFPVTIGIGVVSIGEILGLMFCPGALPSPPPET